MAPEQLRWAGRRGRPLRRLRLLRRALRSIDGRTSVQSHHPRRTLLAAIEGRRLRCLEKIGRLPRRLQRPVALGLASSRDWRAPRACTSSSSISSSAPFVPAAGRGKRLVVAGLLGVGILSYRMRARPTAALHGRIRALRLRAIWSAARKGAVRTRRSSATGAPYAERVAGEPSTRPWTITRARGRLCTPRPAKRPACGEPSPRRSWTGGRSASTTTSAT